MLRIFLAIVLTFFCNHIGYSQEDYFLTLRYDLVNLRQGPTKDHPIKIFYKKKFLPVLVQDKFENFRKIRDHENNTGWVHISQLSKKKAAIIIVEEQLVFNKPSIYSKPSVILKKGRLCKIKKCKNSWCKVEVKNFKGWIKKEALWGLL